MIRAAFGEGDRSAAENELASLMASSMGVADMLGRRRLLLELDAKLGASHGLRGTAPATEQRPAQSLWTPDQYATSLRAAGASTHPMGVAYSAARAYATSSRTLNEYALTHWVEKRRGGPTGTMLVLLGPAGEIGRTPLERSSSEMQQHGSLIAWGFDLEQREAKRSVSHAYSLSDAARALVAKLKRAGSVARSMLTDVEARALGLLVARGLASANPDRAELSRRVWDMPWEVIAPLLMRERDGVQAYRDGAWEQRTRDWRKTLADHVLTVTVNDTGVWWAAYDKASGRRIKQARGMSTQDAQAQADAFVKSLAKFQPSPARPWGIASSESRSYVGSSDYGIGRARGRQAARASHPDETSYGPRREDVDAFAKYLRRDPAGFELDDFRRGYIDGWKEQRTAMGLAPRASMSDSRSDLRESVRYAAAWWAVRAGDAARHYAERAGDTTQPLIPAVTFDQAVADIAKRSARWGPRLTANAKKVAALYAKEHVFALAKSTSLKVTERVQQMLAEALAKGKPMPKVVDAITKLGDWSKAYSTNIYRTNLTAAYTAGRFAQANDPDVKDAFPALRYVSVCDSDARPTHCAMDGAIAAVNDPVWGKWAPPAGFQ